MDYSNTMMDLEKNTGIRDFSRSFSVRFFRQAANSGAMDALLSTIFWIAFLQWLFITLLVDWVLSLVPSVGVLLGAAVNTIVIVVVMCFVLLMPLYLTNNLPVTGLFRQHFLWFIGWRTIVNPHPDASSKWPGGLDAQIRWFFRFDGCMGTS